MKKHTIEDHFEEIYTRKDGKQIKLIFLPNESCVRITDLQSGDTVGELKYNRTKSSLMIKDISRNQILEVQTKQIFQKAPLLALQRLIQLSRQAGISRIDVWKGTKFWFHMGFTPRDIQKLSNRIQSINDPKLRNKGLIKVLSQIPMEVNYIMPTFKKTNIEKVGNLEKMPEDKLRKTILSNANHNNENINKLNKTQLIGLLKNIQKEKKKIRLKRINAFNSRIKQTVWRKVR